MIRIYITNLGKYNEGILMGEWVTLPADEDTLEGVYARIGINEQYEEIFITDSETDIDYLEIEEFTSIDYLNEIAEQTDLFDEYELWALSAFLMNGKKLDSAIESVNDGEYTIYEGCSDMTDVAYHLVDELDMLSNCPENLARYFDYEAFGRDIGIEGSYYQVNGCMVELH